MITKTQKLLLDVIASKLFEKPLPSLSGVDWHALFKEAREQAVFKIVYAAVEPQIPQELLAENRNGFFTHVSEDVRNFYQHGQLHALLVENNIPYVFIKGVASASYYPDVLLRSMGDVDFLVGEADISKAFDLLTGAGYKPGDKQCSSHITFRKEKEIFEMHRRPGGIPEGEKGDLCREYLGDMIETKKEYVAQDMPVFIPDAFHHGFVMLLHTASHMINTGIGLRHLCDWAVFVNSLGDGEFCDIFKEKLQKVGLWRFARLMTGLSVKYLGCAQKQWADCGDEDGLLEAMMTDILDSGNLGKKDVERINEAKLLTTEGTGTVNGSKAILFRAVTEKTYREMPVCKKYKILLPIGWARVLIKHLSLIRRGRRPKIHVAKMITNAETRRNIYSQFKLFQ